LFWAEASTVLESPVFPLKLLFIALAGINALYFEFIIAKQPATREAQAAPPTAARISGAASLTLWVLVVICGRLIAYLPH
jgi:hypothetical protein